MGVGRIHGRPPRCVVQHQHRDALLAWRRIGLVMGAVEDHPTERSHPLLIRVLVTLAYLVENPGHLLDLL
jgi:hypothetical protein